MRAVVLALGVVAMSAELTVEPYEAPAPIFEPTEAQFGRFMDEDPPPMRWALEDALPADVVGLLASGGGVGKSHLIYQLGMSMVSGAPFAGLQVCEPGAFLYVAAEDDGPELHRRGRRILDHFRAQPDWEPIHDAAVAERLHVVSRVGENNLLTARRSDGEVHQTALVDQIAEVANLIPNLRWIVLEPASRFRGGKANDEDDATRFVEAMEALKKATGAGVLTAAHVSQAGLKEGGGAEIVRGSTAFVDGVRWVATMQKLRKDQAADYGVDRDEAARYIRLEIPKSNYTSEFAGMWLRREAGGVLVPTELERRERTRTRQNTERRYQEVLANVQELLAREGPLTPNAIETEYSGRLGPLGAGQKETRDVLKSAVHRGDLEERKNTGRGGGKVLVLPGADE